MATTSSLQLAGRSQWQSSLLAVTFHFSAKALQVIEIITVMHTGTNQAGADSGKITI